MRRLSSILAIGLLFTLSTGSALSREALNPGLRPARVVSEAELQAYADQGLRGLYEEAVVDTYCIVWYSFEQMNWQGWTREERTLQSNYFHVDDFAGLGGGDFGGLVPLEGTKSMWCGTRPNPGDPYLCSWKTAPGYGNRWRQDLIGDRGCCDIGFRITPPVTFSYKISYDSEPDRDLIAVEYSTAYDCADWHRLATYSGRGSTVAEHVMVTTTTKIKFHFYFTSDETGSDEDGLVNTDGACVIDSISVADSTGLLDYQDFESAAVGATGAGSWRSSPPIPFGKYSGLKSNLVDHDPCNDNEATQVVFFIGTGLPSESYGGLYDTPFCHGPGRVTAPCQDELIVSPVIDMRKYSLSCNYFQNGTIPPEDLASLGGASLRYTVYADLPYQNLVFYQWKVRNIVDGCAQPWMDRNLLYWHPKPDYLYVEETIGDLLTSDTVQIAVGVRDMCDVWYSGPGDCAQHTPAPWLDNVRLYRYKVVGPQWSYRDIDLFQDNFPAWEKVRADAAIDINPQSNPVIDPGDSIVVGCTSPIGGGIDTMPNGYPAVYMHVNAHWIGAGSPPGPPLGEVIHGAQLEGSCGLWLSTDGGGWDIIQGDYARTQAGVVEDRYMFDLNDSLFVPGYIIEYYFTAVDNAAVETALPRYARSAPPSPYVPWYFEFTCLPTGVSDVLFVDDASGLGSWNGVVQDYWDSAFRKVLFLEPCPDRYDVNGPTSGVSNGLGSRANAYLLQQSYNVVIWDSGDLDWCTISDGTANSDKSNDCDLLAEWLRMAEHVLGLWVCGDDIAYDLTVNDGLSPQALNLMTTWCGVTLVNGSYFDVTGGSAGGGVTNPLITGDLAGIFNHGSYVDRFIVYGGCPIKDKFDCLGATGNGVYALDYPSYGGASYYAGIQAQDTNAAGYVFSTMWFGFSLVNIRDDDAPEYWPDYWQVVDNVLDWMWYDCFCVGPCGTEAPAANALAQNYPNPFNPVTEIKYGMKERGPVTIRVYDVAGRLVRTLVEGVENAGSHRVAWDGRTNLGRAAASGIYFYKMETKEFSETKKMVLLR